MKQADLPSQGAGGDKAGIDWPGIFYQFSKLFGWSVDQIRDLTFAQLGQYCRQINLHREELSDMEVNIELIRKVLFAFVGIKDPPSLRDEEVSGQLTKSPLPIVQLTAEQRKGWAKAGYPNLIKWLGTNNEK